jgi:DNA polymerase-3 subunit epsilon
MLRGAPTFDEVIDPLLEVMAGAVVVAHNAPFDLGFLAAEFEIAQVPLPHQPVIDTLALVRRAYRFRSNSLSAVVKALGVANDPTHRALEDVVSTLQVLEQVLEGLAARRGIHTLGELVDFQGGSIPYPAVPTLSLPPTIAEALESGGRVWMRYVDARGRETRRAVRPLRVAVQRGNLYLIAHCYRRAATRTFRLDRVVELALEDDR